MNPSRLFLLVALVALAAATRLLPHPPNFAPIAAIALFAGATFADRRLAFAVPFVALFATDLLLGLHATMPFVYAGFALTVLLGGALARQRGVTRLAGVATGASVLFFVLTNFGVWMVQGLYPHTAAGLAACYAAAIPFFQNSLAGDLLYTGLLFGALALAEQRLPRTRNALGAA